MSACPVSTALKRRSKFATIPPRSKSSFFQCVLTAAQSWTLLPPELVHTCSRRLLLRKWRLPSKKVFGGRRVSTPPQHTLWCGVQFNAGQRNLDLFRTGILGVGGGI